MKYILTIAGLALAVSAIAEDPLHEVDATSLAKEQDRSFEPWGGKNLTLDELVKEFDLTPPFEEERLEFLEKMDPQYGSPMCVDAAMAGLSGGGTVTATTVVLLDGSASKGVQVRWGNEGQIAVTPCEDPDDVLPDPFHIVP